MKLARPLPASATPTSPSGHWYLHIFARVTSPSGRGRPERPGEGRLAQSLKTSMIPRQAALAVLGPPDGGRSDGTNLPFTPTRTQRSGTLTRTRRHSFPFRLGVRVPSCGLSTSRSDSSPVGERRTLTRPLPASATPTSPSGPSGRGDAREDV